MGGFIQETDDWKMDQSAYDSRANHSGLADRPAAFWALGGFPVDLTVRQQFPAGLLRIARGTEETTEKTGRDRSPYSRKGDVW